MNTIIKVIVGLLMAVILASCGDTLNTTGSSTNPNSTVSTVTLTADAPQIGTKSTAVSNLTATVKDSTNQVVSGQLVTFSATSGDLTVTQGTTDSSGIAKASLSPGADASNRTVTVTATAGSASATYAVTMAGTQVSIAGATSVVYATPTTLTITVKDSGGAGVPGATVTLSAGSGSLSSTTVTTNTNGQAAVTYTANSSSSSDTVTASALGATASHSLSISSDQFSVVFNSANSAGEININTCAPVTVTWTSAGVGVSNLVSFQATHGTLYTDAVCSTTLASATGNSNQITTNSSGVGTVYIESPSSGPTTVSASATGGPSASASAEFIATTPAHIVLQADHTTLGLNSSATLTATVTDANYNLVKNAVIDFAYTDPTGGNLSVAQGTTDSLGQVSTTYNSTSISSQTNGITVTATVNGTSYTSSVSLTVGGVVGSITIGMATKIIDYNTSTYQYPGSVQVSDSAGNPLAGAVVTLTLVNQSYDKGIRMDDGSGNYVAHSDVALASTGSVFANTGQLSCINEDTNLNDILDAGDNDVNGDGKLEPGRPAVIAPSSVTTDAFGNAAFDIVYPKDYANWIQVKITASTLVSGTETSNSIKLVPPMSQADASSPPGMISPYGTAPAPNPTCTNPN